MSKIANATKKVRRDAKAKAVVNYMGGISYELSPVESLKMVTASSIFAEPAYYRDGEFAPEFLRDASVVINPLFAQYSLFSETKENTSEFMERIIDEALEADFEATIRWAVVLRREFMMRLNPQVIMVRAAMHPRRAEFNKANPGLFTRINEQVMLRADEPASQFAYYLYRNGSKSSTPNVLKRNWAKRLERASRYEIAKYKNGAVGMIDTVRVCHANSPVIDELMKTGTVTIEEDEKTWENMRSAGKSWREILNTCNLMHMALLRNLRGIFTEIDDIGMCRRLCDTLKKGVQGGKQPGDSGRTCG